MWNDFKRASFLFFQWNCLWNCWPMTSTVSLSDSGGITNRFLNYIPSLKLVMVRTAIGSFLTKNLFETRLKPAWKLDFFEPIHFLKTRSHISSIHVMRPMFPWHQWGWSSTWRRGEIERGCNSLRGRRRRCRTGRCDRALWRRGHIGEGEKWVVWWRRWWKSGWWGFAWRISNQNWAGGTVPSRWTRDDKRRKTWPFVCLDWLLLDLSLCTYCQARLVTDWASNLNQITLWLDKLNLPLGIFWPMRGTYLPLVLRHFALDWLSQFRHVDARSGGCLHISSNDKMFSEILATDSWASKKEVAICCHGVRVWYRCFNPDFVFEIIKLEGICPQALERTQRVSDFPLGPAGTIKNSKYGRIIIIL